MIYNVTVDLSPTPDAPPLDALQAEGAASLLDRWLDQVEGLDGDDETPVELVHYAVAAHPGGALMALVVSAGSLGAAETACRDLVEAACEDVEPLASWYVAKAEVELDTGDAEERLADADGWELGDDETVVEVRSEGDDEGMTRERVLAASANFRAFESDAFGIADDSGFAERESATLCMGAVSIGSEILLDGLFADVADLSDVPGSTAADIDTRVLEDLPPQYAHLYDRLFAQRLLVSAVAVADRLAGRWSPCANVAEELALRLMLQQAEVVLDLVAAPQEGADDVLGVFAETVFEDFDADFLYDPRMDGVTPEDLPPGFAMAPMDFASWFVPFNDARTVNPYCLPDAEGRDSNDG